MEALKARIAFLKIRLDEYGTDAGSSPHMTPQNASASTPGQRLTPREPRDDIHSTIQEASYISLSAMAERTDKHRSTAEGLSFKSLLHAAVAAGYTESQPSSSIDESLTVASKFFSTGPHEDSYQAYVHHLDNSCPYIEPTKLDAAYKQTINAHSQAPTVTGSDLPAEHVVLVYLGLATGILLSPNFDRCHKDAEALIACSLRPLNQVVEKGDDLTIVHCLTALAVCSLLSEKAGSTWHLLGLAMTRAVASGMHTVKELDADQQIDRAEQVRAIWALYILDTRVSCALDRPFYLDDTCVANLEGVVLEGQIFHLISQARMIRATRRSKGNDALCNFIDLQHLHETIASRWTAEKAVGLEDYAAGLIEIFKHSVDTSDSNCKSIVMATENIFVDCLASLEDQLIARSRSVTSLEVILVLAIGVTICRLHASRQIAQQQAAYQATNILTLLSTRYSHARGFRDVLMECLMTSANAQAQQPSARLRELIDKLEGQLPSQIEAMIFGKKPL